MNEEWHTTAFALDELSSEERAQVQQWLEASPDNPLELEALTTTLNRTTHMLKTDPKPSDMPTISGPWTESSGLSWGAFALAAGLLVAIGLASFGGYLLTKDEEPSARIARPEILPVPRVVLPTDPDVEPSDSLQVALQPTPAPVALELTIACIATDSGGSAQTLTTEPPYVVIADTDGRHRVTGLLQGAELSYTCTNANGQSAKGTHRVGQTDEVLTVAMSPLKRLRDAPEKEEGPKSVKKPAPMRGFGTLTVRPKTWAKCSVAGIGNRVAPFSVVLAARRYRVTCKKGGLTKRKTVRVKAGKTTVVRFSMYRKKKK